MEIRDYKVTDDLVIEPIGTTKKLSYAVEQRMRLIDFMLKHFGYFKTAALRDHFGISEPQSLRDVRLYKKNNPHSVLYDRHERIYRAALNFKPFYG